MNKGQKIRERNDYIRDEIVAELTKKGLTIKELAQSMGKAPTTVQACIRGFTSPPEITVHIIKIIGFNPWDKFPPVEYVPPTSNHAA